MVRVINQETFDAVVKENMDDFEMSKEEAVKEAKEQFEAQGVNLGNIVMDGSRSEGDHLVVKAITALEGLIDKDDDTEVIANCEIIEVECAKGLAEKMLATEKHGYDLLVKVASKQDNSLEVKIALMKALGSLLEGNPDPLEPEGFVVILDKLDTAEDDERSRELIKATLDCTLNVCVRHEQNRQNLIKNNLLRHLDGLVERGFELEVARVWQSLVQDDDVRVPFGHAHQHAREIVEEHEALSKLVKAINAHTEKKKKDLALLLACLSSLSVRNEYCQAVVNDGALKSILTLLMEPKQDKAVVKECLKAIKTLAGNDNVKMDVAESNGIPLIITAMLDNITSKPISQWGCGAITAICLRSPDNSKQVMAAGGATLLTQILRTHMEHAAIVMSCANAIRNIVSRSRDLSSQFVDNEVESLLNEARSRHPSADEATRSALRDLNLKVELKEEWTGTKKISADP